MVNALVIYTVTSSIESLERLERAHELVTALSVEVVPGSLQTEQKIGSWREALEVYHKTAGSKYLVGSTSSPYCNSKYPTHLVVVNFRKEHRLIDHFFGAQVRAIVEDV